MSTEKAAQEEKSPFALRDKTWAECDLDRKVERLRILVHEIELRECKNTRSLDLLNTHSHDATGRTVVSPHDADTFAFYEPRHFEANGESYY